MRSQSHPFAYLFTLWHHAPHSNLGYLTVIFISDTHGLAVDDGASSWQCLWKQIINLPREHVLYLWLQRVLSGLMRCFLEPSQNRWTCSSQLELYFEDSTWDSKDCSYANNECYDKTMKPFPNCLWQSTEWWRGLLLFLPMPYVLFLLSTIEWNLHSAVVKNTVKDLSHMISIST